jgi:hypothetical protein
MKNLYKVWLLILSEIALIIYWFLLRITECAFYFLKCLDCVRQCIFLFPVDLFTSVITDCDSSGCGMWVRSYLTNSSRAYLLTWSYPSSRAADIPLICQSWGLGVSLAFTQGRKRKRVRSRVKQKRKKRESLLLWRGMVSIIGGNAADYTRLWV